MNDQRHIIRTQHIEIDFPSGMETSGMPHLIDEVFHERILPEMEKLFDAYGGGTDVLVFDRMEIDCGVLQGMAWKDQLVAQTVSKIEEQLRTAPTDLQVQRVATSHLLEAWIYFLAHGYLRWDSPVSRVIEFEERIRIDGEFVTRLLRAVHQMPGALARFMRSFSAPFRRRVMDGIVQTVDDPNLTQLLGVLPIAWQQDNWLQQAVFTALAKVYGKRKDLGSNPQQAFSAYVVQLLQWAPSMYQTQVCHAIAERYVHIDLALGVGFFDQYGGTSVAKRIAQEIRRRSSAAVNRWKQEQAEAVAATRGRKSKGDSWETKEGASRVDSNAEKQVPEPLISMDKPIENDKAIFIENAGLILVHPFLAPLFETLGWVRKGVFGSQEEADRAVLLLHYMAFGDIPVEEVMLPFNKALCGISPEWLVDMTILPDDNAKRESDHVLQAVIQHWEVLKNTSIEGLRETFLRRQGKLERKGDTWMLQVETKAVDVLLNQLPWGISVVKLPWSRDLIQVNWI